MLFSIITINFNNDEGLRQTINSVVCQSYDDYEFIVIDGGSTDESVNIIKSFSNNIDYWVSEKDRGIYHAMNKGVAQAHGDYCIFMNSGDSFFDDMVLKRIADHEIKEDIVVGKLVSNENGQVLFAPPQHQLSFYYLYSGTIPHQSSFIRTELLRQNPYEESLKIVADWKFFVQVVILRNCSVKYVDDYVATFDIEGISTSNPERMWKEKEYVLSELFPSRVLSDYQNMKASECLTQKVTPYLRQHFLLDKMVYNFIKFISKFIN